MAVCYYQHVCVCLNRSFTKPSPVSRICLLCVFCVCVFPKSDWWYLTRPTLSFLLYNLQHTHRGIRTYTHPWCLAILFSHLLWLSLASTAWVTALGLSGYPWLQPRGLCRGTQTCQHSESWNRRWMAESHLCPELCALLVSSPPSSPYPRPFSLTHPLLAAQYCRAKRVLRYLFIFKIGEENLINRGHGSVVF